MYRHVCLSLPLSLSFELKKPRTAIYDHVDCESMIENGKQISMILKTGLKPKDIEFLSPVCAKIAKLYNKENSDYPVAPEWFAGRPHFGLDLILHEIDKSSIWLQPLIPSVCGSVCARIAK